MILKPIKYKGHIITFKKRYKYISPSFPSSPEVDGYVDGKIVASGFTKTEVLKTIKRRLK